MKEKTYQTPCGTIHYWVSVSHPDEITLVFLPGLTADHRLFDKQILYFKEKYNVVVWDAPAHASSWPFRFDFDLFDKAKWLNDILNQEKIAKPVIVGQSMGGYVGQAYAQLYTNYFFMKKESDQKENIYLMKYICNLLTEGTLIHI